MTGPLLVRQPDFSGGEIAPYAYGKLDSPAYLHGLRTALNFIPTLEGMLLNRSGARYVCAVKDSTYAPYIREFKFTDGQSFIIEIGDKYVRFVQSGAQVLNGGAPYEVVAPWAIADVGRLQWSQNGDIITFTHPSYSPYEVARIANTNWTVTPVSFAGTPCFIGADAGDAARPFLATSPNGAGGAALGGPFPAWSSILTYSRGDFAIRQLAGDAGRVHLWQALQRNINNDPAVSPAAWYDWTYNVTLPRPYFRGDYAFYPTDQNMYLCLRDNPIAQPSTDAAQWAAAVDAAHPTTKVWDWVVTQIWQDSLGGTHETLASQPTQLLGVPLRVGTAFASLSVALYTDRPAIVQWLAESVQAFQFKILGYRIYRGRNGIYGLVGTAPPGQYTFNDDGQAPDFGTQPPRGTNPFLVATATDGSAQASKYPGSVVSHEQRTLYARSDAKPQDFWGSVIGDYKRFDVNTPVEDSDSFDFRPASEQLEEIRGLLSLRHLLLFTSSGVWNCYGSNGPITPTNVILRRSLRQGSSYLRPLGIDMSALFYTDRGRVRDLAWNWRTDNYNGRDVSVIARHMLEGRTIIDWAYAETPWSLVWAVRDDGTLLTLSYELGGVEAWARHTTAGVFERVASVSEIDPATGAVEDAVYVVVKRIINGVTKRYIERFSSRILPQKGVVNADGTTTFTQDVRLCNFLDASVQYDGRNLVQGVTVSDASTPPEVPFNGGTKVTLTAAANPIVVAGGPNRGFAAGDIGSSVVVDSESLNGGPVELTIVAVANALSATAVLEGNLPAAFQNVALNAALAIQTVTGLAHLEAQSVNVLGDGGVSGPYTVVGGQIVLGSPAVIVQVGIGYNSDMELLDMASERAKVNVKSVTKAYFEVVSSRGLLCGESFDVPPGSTVPKLRSPQLQKVSDGNSVPPLFTGIAEVSIGSSWNQGARMCLRQSDPLPLTVVAAVRDVVIAGRA